MQITSQLSLLDCIAENKIGPRQQQILDLFNGVHKCLNNREISQMLNLPINSVTPRTNELVEMGKLKEYKKDKDNFTNRQTIFWGLS